MTENKMAEVAKLFGKGLNEPFVVYVPFHKCRNEAVLDAIERSLAEKGYLAPGEDM
jgi:hypothetical protein